MKLLLAMAAAAAMQAESPQSRYEAAMAARDLHEAGEALGDLVEERRPRDAIARPDPLLAAYSGRLAAAWNATGAALAFLKHATGPEVDPAIRAPALLALADVHQRLNDHRAALANLDAATRLTMSEGLAVERDVLRLRSLLATDPAAAARMAAEMLPRQNAPAAQWEIQLLLGHALAATGDAAGALAAADRAWALAPAVGLYDHSVARTALLRAGLAAAGGNRDAFLSMLSAAGGDDFDVSFSAEQLPQCGEKGVAEGDYVRLAMFIDAQDRPLMLPVQASRIQVIPAFFEALAGFSLDGTGIAGSIVTLRCRVRPTQSLTGPVRPVATIDWMTARGLFMDGVHEGGLEELNALSARVSERELQNPDDPQLIPLRTQLAALLGARAATAGDVELWQVQEQTKKAEQAMRALGGAEGLFPSTALREDLDRLTALAASGGTPALAELERVSLAVIREAPLDEAFEQLARLLDATDEAPAPESTKRKAIEILLARSTGDPRRPALLRRLGELQMEAGEHAAGRKSFREAGVGADICVTFEQKPRLAAGQIEDGTFPSDAQLLGMEGTTLLGIDIGADGKVSGTRVLVSTPSEVFDSLAVGGVSGFTYSPAHNRGRAGACRELVQRIRWQLPEADEFQYPQFAAPAPGGS